MEEVKSIVNDIKAGQIKPVYFLMGDEPYYIDRISDLIENSILSEEEKGFNQMVLYGRDVEVESIVSHAKRFPMMAQWQVIIVKEAQSLSRSIEKLAEYIANPQLSTVLVFCYKYKKLDKRLKLYKLLKKQGVVFESKKLYENQVSDWIRRLLKDKGYTITPKASHMLVEFLGTDLSKINKELEKLQIIIKPGAEISPELIEENIGISKDFNIFELNHAIGNKNVAKAFGIINYFSQNPKHHPLVMTLGFLYGFFSKVFKYHALNDKSKAASVLGVNPYFVKDYQIAARHYPMRKVSAIIASIREIDMKSKGVGAANVPHGDLLKELLVSIFD